METARIARVLDVHGAHAITRFEELPTAIDAREAEAAGDSDA